MMNEDEARKILANADPKRKSVDLILIKAFEALPRFEKFKELLKSLGRGKEKSNSSYYTKLQKCWRISRLPKGIRWRVEQRKISISHADIITKLNDAKDQYVLALGMDYGKRHKSKINLSHVKKIVRLVKKGKTMRDALDEVASIRFKDTPHMLDKRNPEKWIAVCKEAWERRLEWTDFCNQLIDEKANVLTEIREIAEDDICKKCKDHLQEYARSIKTLLDHLKKTFLDQLELDQLAELKKLKASIQSGIEEVENQLNGVAKKLRELSQLSGE